MPRAPRWLRLLVCTAAVLLACLTRGETWARPTLPSSVHDGGILARDIDAALRPNLELVEKRYGMFKKGWESLTLCTHVHIIHKWGLSGMHTRLART